MIYESCNRYNCDKDPVGYEWLDTDDLGEVRHLACKEHMDEPFLETKAIELLKHLKQDFLFIHQEIDGNGNLYEADKQAREAVKEIDQFLDQEEIQS